MSHHRVPSISRAIALALLVLVTVPFAARAQQGFDPNADHTITLAEALNLTGAARAAVDSESVRAFTFGRDAVLKLLEQPGCHGLRIYEGKGADGQRTLVLVGVDLEGKDMYLDLLDDKGWPCPPVCDGSSPLNGK